MAIGCVGHRRHVPGPSISKRQGESRQLKNSPEHKGLLGTGVPWPPLHREAPRPERTGSPGQARSLHALAPSLPVATQATMTRCLQVLSAMHFTAAKSLVRVSLCFLPWLVEKMEHLHCPGLQRTEVIQYLNEWMAESNVSPQKFGSKFWKISGTSGNFNMNVITHLCQPPRPGAPFCEVTSRL